MPVRVKPNLSYLIGADPELFLVDSSGAFVSAHNVIPGTKVNPCGVLGGAIQVDGTAAEFNIHPAGDEDAFVENIRDVLTELQGRVSATNKDLFLNVMPTAHFDAKYFKYLPKKAKELGCDPDFDAYTGKPNTKPKTSLPMRTGGGHIHLGWGKDFPLDDAHLFDCRELVKQLDAVLYHCSLLWDDDATRRQLYGKIGSFRPKSYGVEYRPLSNAWVSDPDLQRWVFRAAKWAALQLDDGNMIYDRPTALEMLHYAKRGESLLRHHVIDYHDYLVVEQDMPPLPEGYTRSIQ